MRVPPSIKILAISMAMHRCVNTAVVGTSMQQEERRTGETHLVRLEEGGNISLSGAVRSLDRSNATMLEPIEATVLYALLYENYDGGKSLEEVLGLLERRDSMMIEKIVAEKGDGMPNFEFANIPTLDAPKYMLRRSLARSQSGIPSLQV